MKMGYFYEQLFCYLCNFIHPKTGFDLINEKEQIFIELKTDWNTDNHNSKESKFHLLSKYKRNNPNAKVYYICLNDKRKINVNYAHHFGFPNNNRYESLGVLLSTRGHQQNRLN